MADLALYRKYRSADFTQVVGQEHVVQTLTNALASDRVSHAYLFTGPRGTGKTTVARLLARGLNCTSDSDRPCNNCANCKAALSSSLDIIEIDAASNRRIEEMRDLRDKIGLAPAAGKYKVYIIDEVHMLTTEAFNALLKTLEEPPAHAVFILATTEAHKLPETIVSRTQRFNFRPLNQAEIVGQLRWIADAESIGIDDEALQVIAQASRGGFRDAISLLDQLASGGNATITADHVRSILGWSDLATLEALCRAVAEGQSVEALKYLDTLLSQGAQPGQVAMQLLDVWRRILLASVGAREISLELSKPISAQFAALAVEQLIKVTRSPMPALSLEAAIVRLTTVDNEVVLSGAIPSMVKPAAKAAVIPNPTPVGDSAFVDLWPKALLAVKERNNNLSALLKTCKVEAEGDKVVLLTRFNFHRDRIMEAKNRTVVEQVLEKVYGKPYQVVAQLDAGAAERRMNPPAAGAELISSALEILGGGEVVE